MLHITQRINYPIPYNPIYPKTNIKICIVICYLQTANFIARHIVTHERSYPTRQSKHVLLDAVRRKGLDQNESHQLFKTLLLINRKNLSHLGYFFTLQCFIASYNCKKVLILKQDLY